MQTTHTKGRFPYESQSRHKKESPTESRLRNTLFTSEVVRIETVRLPYFCANQSMYRYISCYSEHPTNKMTLSVSREDMQRRHMKIRKVEVRAKKGLLKEGLGFL